MSVLAEPDIVGESCSSAVHQAGDVGKQQLHLLGHALATAPECQDSAHQISVPPARSV